MVVVFLSFKILKIFEIFRAFKIVKVFSVFKIVQIIKALNLFKVRGNFCHQKSMVVPLSMMVLF